MDETETRRVLQFIDSLNPLVMLGINLIGSFEKVSANLQKRFNVHEAIGIIDPTNYEIQQKEYKLRIKRLNAIMNLLKVYRETQETIKEIRSENKSENPLGFLYF